MILIDTPLRPAATTWASALLMMNGGLFLVPVAALLVFGVLPQVAPNVLTPALVLAALGATLLFTARAVWRGAHWPRHYVIVVVVGEFIGLVIGYTYLIAALLFVAPAAVLLWQRSARRFAAAATEAPVSTPRIPKT
jgi:hypothetical protein